MKATEFDQLFDDNQEDIMEHLDLKNARRPNLEVAMMSFERDVLNTFHATGADWQHQINVALKQWLQEHPLELLSS